MKQFNLTLINSIPPWSRNDYKNHVLIIQSDFMGKSKKSVNYKAKQTRAGNASINII